jgi:predicted peptidase
MRTRVWVCACVVLALAAAASAVEQATGGFQSDQARALFMRGSAITSLRTTPVHLKPRFEHYVFDSDEFPAFDYPDTGRAREFAGNYRVAVQFYNRDGQAVSKASAPGRYSAVVTVTSEAGDSFTLNNTLYRLGYAHEQRRAMTEEKTAMILALADAEPDARAAEAARENARRWHELRRSLGTAMRYEYAAVPPAGYQTDETKKWPVLLYLHGGGAAPAPLDQLRDKVMRTLRGTRETFPFIVVIPRAPTLWDPFAIGDVLDEVLRQYRADPDRVYLTGYSAGGYAAWLTAVDLPERFAAVSPGGSWGETVEIARIKDIPVWFFQGDRDALPQAMKTIDALKRLGARFRYTIFPGADHSAGYGEMYATDALYDWLLQQRRGHPAQPPS